MADRSRPIISCLLVCEQEQNVVVKSVMERARERERERERGCGGLALQGQPLLLFVIVFQSYIMVFREGYFINKIQKMECAQNSAPAMPVSTDKQKRHLLDYS
jgi:hypothetical protein